MRTSTSSYPRSRERPIPPPPGEALFCWDPHVVPLAAGNGVDYVCAGLVVIPGWGVSIPSWAAMAHSNAEALASWTRRAALTQNHLRLAACIGC